MLLLHCLNIWINVRSQRHTLICIQKYLNIRNWHARPVEPTDSSNHSIPGTFRRPSGRPEPADSGMIPTGISVAADLISL